ncbi:THAP domain-containing protein 1 [Acropora cervicornis]|uniref:THAP domain-containing protein 1 n=1 Tax=Acropora cervicornis TaxID=6130 RepID=A0AAD9Q4M9_ACRCE|nr:THAP domain-containing protein 1 [Acropora cervicornis]
MVEKCVVYGCSNSKNKQKGISIHKIPSDSDPRAEVRRRRQRWIKFVNQTRKHWTPGKTSSICSVHFKHEDFKRPFNSALKGALGYHISKFQHSHLKSSKYKTLLRNLRRGNFPKEKTSQLDSSPDHLQGSLALPLSRIDEFTALKQNYPILTYDISLFL